MIDSTYFEPNNADTSLSTRRTRSAMACNGCRKLKMKCANINRERCERCKDKNILCEYSNCASTRSGNANSSQSIPKSQAAIDPSIMPGGMSAHQSVAPQATAATHSSGQSVSRTAANRRADISYAPSNVTACSCEDPQVHGCVVSQIPVGELSEEMNALNREIAQRYPALPTLHD